MLLAAKMTAGPGRGCSTSVQLVPHDPEVVVSNAGGCGAFVSFIFLSVISRVSIIGPSWRCFFIKCYENVFEKLS